MSSRRPPCKSELLIPAGSLEKLKVAVLYGADAVYLGTPDMSLRTKSDFTLEDVVEGVRFAHRYGVRVYLTLNLFAHNKDVRKLDTFIATVRTVAPDGLIVADPGVFQYVRSRAPDLPLHVSTQANVCSSLGVKFWKSQGAELVVLAREVSFEELSEIRRDCPDIKLEAFVHGAMCMTYSGRCLLSNFMCERGANQGNCANSCRWNYKLHLRLKDGTIEELVVDDSNRELFEYLLEEEVRPGDLMPIVEDERGSYILNSKDLCLLPKLDQYLHLGIDSLKVEGRGKSMYYVAVVTRAYRMAIDAWSRDPENWTPAPFIAELDRVPSRGYTLAFHDGRLTHLAHGYQHTGQVADVAFAGYIVDHERNQGGEAIIVDVRNRLDAGEVLEFVPPSDAEVIRLRLYEFEIVGRSNRADTVHPGQGLRLRIALSLFDQEDLATILDRLPIHTVIRKEKPLTESEYARVKMDRAARRLETGRHEMGDGKSSRDQELYQVHQIELKEARQNEATRREPRFIRMGNKGCCGKGCNGCLVFWQDPAYEKGRELMKSKKLGERLK
ncbi:putative protease YhbU precursor [Novipirellula aureliae]|uniref:Putative protease YhbU n=1 Tax=Novipirellula aureliae TaxID=2527966 RepID=A0A5C6DYF0_9BACT|nr:U32 family peptidase [Novipirellula aureliae]TWU41622.1 putative protease YhbU precursor [Novipirellula aureliae]